ncbi:hypothetical protein CC78DRAFT_585509 [Lojkania enalia]|uniref:Uncharacterized protein n=1 Tax=Lojkania enalia TaxID=147567 RepID=A0A9P4N2J6_9PLEO|nr:hypothetical protein CC78DRAFT_585509 [Didymosphaeria enalia]
MARTLGNTSCARVLVGTNHGIWIGTCGGEPYVPFVPMQGLVASTGAIANYHLREGLIGPDTLAGAEGARALLSAPPADIEASLRDVAHDYGGTQRRDSEMGEMGATRQAKSGRGPRLGPAACALCSALLRHRRENPRISIEFKDVRCNDKFVLPSARSPASPAPFSNWTLGPLARPVQPKSNQPVEMERAETGKGLAGGGGAA